MSQHLPSVITILIALAGIIFSYGKLKQSNDNQDDKIKTIEEKCGKCIEEQKQSFKSCEAEMKQIIKVHDMSEKKLNHDLNVLFTDVGSLTSRFEERTHSFQLMLESNQEMLKDTQTLIQQQGIKIGEIKGGIEVIADLYKRNQEKVV